MSKILNLLKNKIFILISIILLLIIIVGTIFTINYNNQFDIEGKNVAKIVYMERWFDPEDIQRDYEIKHYVIQTKFDLYEPVYTVIRHSIPKDENEKKQFPQGIKAAIIKLKRDSLSNFNFYKKEKTYQQTLDRFMKLEDILDFVSKTNIRDNNPDQKKWGTGTEEPTPEQLTERKNRENEDKTKIENKEPCENEKIKYYYLINGLQKDMQNSIQAFREGKKLSKTNITIEDLNKGVKIIEDEIIKTEPIATPEENLTDVDKKDIKYCIDLLNFKGIYNQSVFGDYRVLE